MPVGTARGWDLHDHFNESSHRSTAVLGMKLQSKFTRDKPCADCSVGVRTNVTATMAETPGNMAFCSLVRWLRVWRCSHIYKNLFLFLVKVGGSSPLWVAPLLGRPSGVAGSWMSMRKWEREWCRGLYSSEVSALVLGWAPIWLLHRMDCALAQFWGEPPPDYSAGWTVLWKSKPNQLFPPMMLLVMVFSTTT